VGPLPFAQSLSTPPFFLQRTDSLDRADLFANFKPGGKYERIVAIYRAYGGFEPVFDRALIDVLPPTVRWIAHNGAGYDSIDIKACKDRGMYSRF